MEKEAIKRFIKAMLEEIQKVEYNDELFVKEMADLKIDSISFIKLLVKIEVEFDITFGENINLISQNTTVNEIVDLVSSISDQHQDDRKDRQNG